MGQLNFGKYREVDFDEIPVSYLEWLERTKYVEFNTITAADGSARLNDPRARKANRDRVQNYLQTYPAYAFTKRNDRSGLQACCFKPPGGSTTAMQELNAEVGRARKALRQRNVVRVFTMDEDDL
jgi:hypothetical protein